MIQRAAGQAVIPDRHCTIVVLPQNIRMAIAVEVADTGDVLSGTTPGLATQCPPLRWPLSQIDTVPSSLCHRISERPLPSKSPTPAICQLFDGTGISHRVAGGQLTIVPDEHLAVVVPPENVALAAAVEIADLGDVRGAGYDSRI